MADSPTLKHKYNIILFEVYINIDNMGEVQGKSFIDCNNNLIKCIIQLSTAIKLFSVNRQTLPIYKLLFVSTQVTVFQLS